MYWRRQCIGTKEPGFDFERLWPGPKETQKRYKNYNLDLSWKGFGRGSSQTDIKLPYPRKSRG
jgi:hypothetical protein